MLRSAVIVLGLFLAAAGPCHATPPSPRFTALEKLATAGNAEALYHVGMAYHLGSGVPQDKAKALDSFRRAADLGDPLAAYKVGCYYDGQGEGLVQPDAQVAYYWKSIAAEAGYAPAQADAAALDIGLGNMAAARDWLEKSAAQGWPGGLLGYASIHNETGKGALPRDKVKTAAWFRLFTESTDVSPAQTDWLAAFAKKLTDKQRAEAATIVAAYQPHPTALTLKGLSGKYAADALVKAAGEAAAAATPAPAPKAKPRRAPRPAAPKSAQPAPD